MLANAISTCTPHLTYHIYTQSYTGVRHMLVSKMNYLWRMRIFVSLPMHIQKWCRYMEIETTSYYTYTYFAIILLHFLSSFLSMSHFIYSLHIYSFLPTHIFMYTQDWDVKLMDMWGLINNEYAILSTSPSALENLDKNVNNRWEVPHLCAFKWDTRYVIPE